MRKSSLRKSRFFYLHPEANEGKITSLEVLQEAYTAYLKVCVDQMLQEHRFKMALSEKKDFFSFCETLSSNIVRNVQDQAIGIISGWAASKYITKIKGFLKGQLKSEDLDKEDFRILCTIGKYSLGKASARVSQEMLDLYWSLLLDEEVAGKPPTISIRCGMRLCVNTATFENSEDTRLTSWWLGFSHLNVGKPRIQLPLSPSPYIKKASEASKGILARKTKTGRWRFEIVERKDWKVPEAPENAPKIGVDVGLNVMAATSDGRLLGARIKSKFNLLYERVKSLRANRFRQNLKDNSSKLDRLESKLSGLIKTAAGEATNKLVKAYQGYVFVVEDLDLSGCRGQKRFAYRALHHSLESKAPTRKVNPAYSSQTCPSCGHVSRRNRVGTKFHCQHCGRKAHADVIGGIGLLRRSEDKQIGLEDHPSVVKPILEARHEDWKKFQTSLSVIGRSRKALSPASRELTTKVSKELGTASNYPQVV